MERPTTAKIGWYSQYGSEATPVSSPLHNASWQDIEASSARRSPLPPRTYSLELCQQLCRGRVVIGRHRRPNRRPSRPCRALENPLPHRRTPSRALRLPSTVSRLSLFVRVQYGTWYHPTAADSSCGSETTPSFFCRPGRAPFAATWRRCRWRHRCRRRSRHRHSLQRTHRPFPMSPSV